MATSGNLLEKAIESVGGKESFERKFRQYGESIAFVDNNHESLLKKYGEEWIAVYEAKVIAHNKTYEEVEKQIREKGLPLEEVVIKFLTTRKMLTLF